MERADLLISIKEKIKDYRKGEIQKIVPGHVERWINQFDVNDQPIILNEINHILETFYLCRENVKMYVKSVLLDERVSGQNPRITLSKMNFLRNQTSGNSQREMLNLVDEILNEEFDITIDQCGGSNLFFYIDDCVFTGNRFRYDVVPWINKTTLITGSKLMCYHIGQHAKGYSYALDYIRQAARIKNLEISPWYHKKINNIKERGTAPEILWPSYQSDIGHIYDYYSEVKSRCAVNGWTDTCYRSHTIAQDTLFTTPYARDIVERAFLKVGSRLVAAAENPARSIRPLGFEKLESLGFGTFFITYRNISNNCPLALWYGDPDQFDGPLSLWYPLFVRKTQRQNLITGWEDLF